MKFSRIGLSPLAAAIFAAASSVAFAQTTATTDPVGFITLNAAGTGGSGTGAISFSSLGLTKTLAYQGNAEGVTSTSLTDNDATWTTNQFNPSGATAATATFYVELTSGTGAGTTYDIIGTTGNTITVAQPFAAGVAAGVSFKIRAYWTIADVFGPNDESGLGQGDASSADQIRVYNNGAYTAYYYSNVGGVFIGTGWRMIGDPQGPHNDRSGDKFYPDDGILITRNQSATLPVVLMGAVKSGQTSTPIFAGLNIVANPYAAPMTLTSSMLYTGVSGSSVAAGDSSSADKVRIYNTTNKAYDTYYYSNVGGLIGVGWRLVGDPQGPSHDVGASVQIPVGVGILVTAGTAFNWVAPQHPASFN